MFIQFQQSTTVFHLHVAIFTSFGISGSQIIVLALDFKSSNPNLFFVGISFVCSYLVFFPSTYVFLWVATVADNFSFAAYIVSINYLILVLYISLQFSLSLINGKFATLFILLFSVLTYWFTIVWTSSKRNATFPFATGSFAAAELFSSIHKWMADWLLWLT